MPPYHSKAYILAFLLASYPIKSGALDFSQCFADVISCAQNSSGLDCISSINISSTTALSVLRTSNGSPIEVSSSPNVATASGLSYSGCVEYCGNDQEPSSWSEFSREYSAWLLPYLAMLSQLPFGARRRTDNLMSVILTLGSPTLAGYSLYMTLLNARWINDKLFAGIDYPSATVRHSVVRVLNSLQQVPLRVHPGRSARFESLVVHPDNDDWWTTFAAELGYSHRWSIASAIPILWVVIAYLLTVVDSLSNVADNMGSNGQGTGSVWLWLLPIVVGWLVLSPKCDYNRVYDAYDKANRRVFVADSCDPYATPTHVTFNFGLTIRPDWNLHDRNTTSPDESRTPPVFNYARTLSWSRTAYVTSLFYHAAWQKSEYRVGVDGKYIPWDVRNDVPRGSRLGNRDQIIQYCRPDDHEYTVANVRWPRGVFNNMIVASLMSLQLQWGTTGAAVLVAWFSPPVGLGCRSLAYLIYGVLSTTVWMLLVSSSIVGYYAHRLMDDLRTPDSESDEQRTPLTPSKSLKITQTNSFTDDGSGSSTAIPLRKILTPDADTGGEDMQSKTNSDEPASITTIEYSHPGRRRARTIARVADWLRWIGKSVAMLNAIGIVANSVFQYAGVYQNCYCDSSIFAWGSSAFTPMTLVPSDVALASSAWIGAVALSLSCCIFFVGMIYLMRDSLPS